MHGQAKVQGYALLRLYGFEEVLDADLFKGRAFSLARVLPEPTQEQCLLNHIPKALETLESQCRTSGFRRDFNFYIRM